MADVSIMIRVDSGGDIARGMSESGSFPDDIKAAAILRQGSAPSMASAAVGFGLWKMLKPRTKRDLPRVFVLAVTESEALAFKARGVGNDDSDYFVTVWAEPLGSWPRSEVTLHAGPKGLNRNVVVELAGERVPCSAQADETLEPLEAELGGAQPTVP
jgi:hypothetical protein